MSAGINKIVLAIVSKVLLSEAHILLKHPMTIKNNPSYRLEVTSVGLRSLYTAQNVCISSRWQFHYIQVNFAALRLKIAQVYLYQCCFNLDVIDFLVE